MFELSVIVICIFLNAILAGSEIAFIATNKASLKVLAEKGDKTSKLLLELRGQPEKILSTIQVGITFLGAFAAALGGAGVQEKLYPLLNKYLSLSPYTSELISTIILVIPLTYFSVVIGELVPKTLALRNPMRLAIKTAPWLYTANRIMFPLVKILEWSTKKIISYFPREIRIPPNDKGEDLILEEAITPLNKQYILNMVKIDRTQVKDIFLKWQYVDYISSDSSIGNVEQKILISGHTRLPIEKNGQVIGVLNSKEFFALQKSGGNHWQKLAREPLKIQSTTLIINALKILQSNSMHMAIVYEKERLIGIVTMEDIFEEIVGEIYDEDDDGSIKKILSQTT